MLEVLQADYMRTAKAKGLREREVVLRHGLRNAMLPVITLIGIDFGTTIGAAVLTETVFSFAGRGHVHPCPGLCPRRLEPDQPSF
jgi:peptide/nickel transport system permease protein